MDTILYEVHDNLYVNLTNRCPCACTFCLRQTHDTVGRSGPLWLSHEPSAEEVIAAFSDFDMTKYNELVFCGFGEPTCALDVLLKVADYAKAHFSNKIRLNTNGLADLVNKKSVAPLLKGRIDIVSISLNTPDPKRYKDIVRPEFGEKAFSALLDFARECVKYVPSVILSTVSTTITKEEEEVCADICREIGAAYRIREYEG
ncbi:MAG: TIGR04100 family radical SAM protein [Lachnospiraceae bacterium]|nr:TIGR04100 family radical SAM protein [Lachnospiraceae bacterium]